MQYQIDHAHTHIQFAVRHMMIAKVRGMFEKFTGEVRLDENDPTRTQVFVQIETASINTRDSQRDAHLRSPDFFNSEQYPSMTFESRRVILLGDRHARLEGDLTIRDVTRPVSLEVEYMGKARSPWGKESLGFSASGKFNRKEWGLTWNQALETGGMLVGDDIELSIELELVAQPEAEAEMATA